MSLGAIGKSGKTLVVLPIGLGNFILSTPALEALSRNLGPERLHLLALKAGVAEMAGASRWFGQVHLWDPDRQSVFQGLGLIGKLRGEKFQHLLSLYPTSHWKFSLYSAFCGAQELWGFRYPEPVLSNRIFHQLVPVEPVHDVVQNVNLVTPFLNGKYSGESERPEGVAREKGPDVMRAGDAGLDERFSIEKKLSFPAGPAPHLEGKLQGKRYYVCHPGSSNERGMWRKRLPAAKFADIIERVYGQTGFSCLLMGGPEEQHMRVESYKNLTDTGAFFNQPTRSLAELHAVIRGARFFLGNDSGMMHMAAALEKPCIAFFGPSDENRTGPWPIPSAGRGSPHLVLRNPEFTPKADASKSVRAKYAGAAGLDTLKVDAVWPRIESFLEKVLG